MKRLAVLAIGIIAAFFVWHAFLTLDVKEQARKLGGSRAPKNVDLEVSVNFFTNVVSIEVGSPLSKRDDNPLGALGSVIESALGQAFSGVLEPSIERDLNLRARERFDVYAMILPYRVRVETPERDQE